MIRTCTCKHKEQDKLHSNQQRVVNPTQRNRPDNEHLYARCTVCSTEKVVRE